MSVDAVGAQNAQERRSNPIGSAIAGGVGLGAVAAAVGYVAGNKRPDLEKVFTQEPDSFKSEAVKGKDAEAAKKLQDAVTEYKNAGASERNTLRSSNRALTSAINAQTLDNQKELEETLNKAKDAYNKKEVEVDGTKYKRSDIAKKLNEAQAKVKAAESGDEAAKTAAKKELDEARKAAEAFHKGTKDEATAVRDAQKAISTAKKTKFDTAAKVAGSTEHGLVEAAVNADKGFKAVKSTKLSEILGRDEIKQAFEKIKEGIPKKGGLKWAGIAGGIAAAVGLIAGYVMGKGGDNA